LLSVEGLTKAFGGLVAVNNLSFKVGKEEIVGLIGPNGSGKSTVVELITGFYRPTKGRIFFDGHEIGSLPPHKVLARGIARTFQTMDCMPAFSVYDTVRLAALHVGSEEHARQRTDRAIEDNGIAARKKDLVSSIPRTDRMAVEMARLTVSDPRLILLDELMAGLSEDEAESVIRQIRTLREKGTSFLVVEHRMEIVTKLCDRLIVLNFGEKIAEGPTGVVLNDPVVIDAYLGTETAHA